MILHDHWGRQFRYLRLSLTDACNMRCSYCLPDGYQPGGARPEPLLGRAEIRRLAWAFAHFGTRKIRLTGGEPSLRRDLPAILHDLRQQDSLQTLALTTNGLKLRQHLADWRAAGLDQLNISLDSLSPERFARITGHDRLPRLLDDIDFALADGWALKINTVLLREHSAPERPAFLDWLRSRPLTLRFIELMRTHDNAAWYPQQHLRGEDWLNQLVRQGWQEIRRPADAGPAREFRHPDYAGRLGFILPYSPKFCESCNRLRVSARGALHLCLFTGQGHSLRDLLQDDDQQAALRRRLQQLIQLKAAGHALLADQSGGNRHFAAIGG